MSKYILLSLVFFVIVNGYIFSDDYNEENAFPKNTITVDIGSTASTLITWGIMGDIVFGTAVQYERQILNKVSLASRFEYRVISISSSDGSTTMASFSAEGRGRYFPGGDIFFLDGMLGYANFNYRDEAINSTSHYFKLGAKLGWRIDFGKPGGLVLEPAIGYSWAIGKNNDIKFIEGSDEISSFFNRWLNRYYEYIIKGYFVGGLQVSLGLGYRF